MTDTKIEKQFEEIQTTLRKMSRRENSWRLIIWRGILFGIGSTLGAVIILYSLLIILQKLEVLPGVGTIFQRITPLIEQSLKR
ncbi:hypothetical protein HYW32_01020 [Candidatus Berkelbacteria bacterium]|nr:hypothetical protein [Candidatus Berkelbacteria bacterium]